MRRRTEPRSTRKALAFYAFLAAAVLAVAGLGLSFVFGSPAASTGTVRTTTVTRGTVQLTESSTGSLSSAVTDNLNFAVGGTVTAINVAAGQQVKAGQVLATIQSSQAEANLASARATLSNAEATLSTAEQGGSASSKDTNAANLVGATSALSSAERQLADDESTLSEARATLAADRTNGCPETASSSGSTASGGSGSASSGASSASSATGTTSSTSSTSSTSTTSSTGASTTSGGSTGGQGSTAHLERVARSSSIPRPVAATGAATGIGLHGATLSGTIDPEGGATTYTFELGTSSAYGKTTPVASAGSGTTATTVSATVSGLKADTVYVYRLVATNAAGTVTGEPATFTTATSSCAAADQAVASDEAVVAKDRASVTQASDSLAATRASIAESSQSAGLAVAADEATVAADEATVSQDESDLAGTRLVAPISGTVLAVNGNVGDTVSAGSSSSSGTGSGAAGSGSASTSSSASSGFVTIADLSNFEVVVGFPEADISDVAVGQPATVTLPALPNTELPGKVTAVSPESSVSSNVVTYDVTIAVSDPPSSVKDGMTADVSVVVRSASGVLEVPSSAVTTTGSRSTVTLLESNHQVVQPVVTGIVGSSTTEIVSGLKAGEEVVLPTVSVSAASSSSSSGGFGGAGAGGGLGGAFFRAGRGG